MSSEIIMKIRFLVFLLPFIAFASRADMKNYFPKSYEESRNTFLKLSEDIKKNLSTRCGDVLFNFKVMNYLEKS